MTAVAFCLEPHDLVLSKLAANRDRDWAVQEAAVRHIITEGFAVNDLRRLGFDSGG